LPPQPHHFFKNLYNTVLLNDAGFIVLARFQTNIVAAAVYLVMGKKIIYKYGASDKAFLHLRPNNLIMWEAIQWYCQKGFMSFNFGRTEPDNLGLLQFKRGWGTIEEKVHYFKYNLEKNKYVLLKIKN